METVGTLTNSFCEANIILIQNQVKTQLKKENYRPIVLMKLDSKMLNKIFANRIYTYIKQIKHTCLEGSLTGKTHTHLVKR